MSSASAMRPWPNGDFTDAWDFEEPGEIVEVEIVARIYAKTRVASNFLGLRVLGRHLFVIATVRRRRRTVVCKARRDRRLFRGHGGFAPGLDP